MLKSIIKGKIKYWSFGNHRINKGTQINPRTHFSELKRNHCELKYNLKEGVSGNLDSHYKTEIVSKNYIEGHFRWNEQAYLVSRQLRDYLENFYFGTNHEINFDNEESKLRFNILNYTTSRLSESTYYLDVTTLNGNDYRYFYFPLGGGFGCNYGDYECNHFEQKFILNSINFKFNSKFKINYNQKVM